MKIHVIGTVNGVTNEGMRNVATHISKVFEKKHRVQYSSLRSPWSVCKNALRSDVTLVFARGTSQVYWLMRIVERLCRNVWLVCVQRPMDGFLTLNTKRPLKCGYFYLTPEDLQTVTAVPGKEKHLFHAGINAAKFTPVGPEKQRELKKKYGFDPTKPVVVHVGHCSSGRGLEAFRTLDKQELQRLIVASGMFEDPDTAAALEADGIRIHRGYLDCVEEIYQLADVYLFPTRSNEFVISIPLSVMEALACGTPVVGHRAFENLSRIGSAEGAVTLVDTDDQWSEAVRQAAQMKQSESLLKDTQSWEDSANSMINVIRSTMQ